MATWTAVGPDSFWYTSWVADMGPYIGPNPVSVDWLPQDADEIDFFVGLWTGDLNTGVMSDRWADAYRYRRYDGSEQSRGVEVGTIGTDTFVTPGVEAHLYVQWFTPGYPNDAVDLVPPSLKPEQVVPCIYVRGGRGPYFGPGVTVPAHWSDWQPGFVASSGFVPRALDVPGQRFCASLDTNAGTKDPANYIALSEGTQYVHPPQPLPLPDRNLIELGAESLARQRAGAAADDLFNRGGINQVFGWKRYVIGSDGYPYDPTYQLHDFEAYTRINQYGEVFVMPDASSLPHPPVSFPTYEWEGSPTGTVQLRDQSVDIVNVGGYDQPGSQNFQSGTPLEHTATETFEIWAIPGTGPGANSIRVDPSTTGIKLLEFELSTHLHADDSVSYDPAQTLTIPYSMIPSSWAHFTLIYQPRLFHSGDGASLWYDIPAPDPTGPENGTFRAYQYGIVPDGWVVSPPYDIRTPRYRYFIPEVHTPGALQCCPNQKLKTTVVREPHPGGLSDWQPGYTYTVSVAPSVKHFGYAGIPDGSSQFADGSADPLSDQDQASWSIYLNDLVAKIQAGQGHDGGSGDDTGLGRKLFHLVAGSSSSLGKSYAFLGIGYQAMTLLGSEHLAVTDAPAPPGYEFESSTSSFVGWQELVSNHAQPRRRILLSHDSGGLDGAIGLRPRGLLGAAFYWGPAIGTTGFLNGTDSDGTPLYVGGLTPISSLHLLNAGPGFGHAAPGGVDGAYTGGPDPAAQVVDIEEFSVQPGMGGQFISDLDVSVYVMPSWAGAVPILTPTGSTTDMFFVPTGDEFYVFDYDFQGPASLGGGTFWAGSVPTLQLRTPRYRYPLAADPGEIAYECSGQPPYLRMTQRNDGLGISPHPQLGLRSTSSNNPGVAPRIGRAARYE